MFILYKTLIASTALSALAFGLMMVMDPTGSSLGVEETRLTGSGLCDFFVPGMFLCLGVGGTGMTSLLLHLIRHPKAGAWSLISGLVLCGWITLQLILVGLYPLFQLLYFLFGLLLCWFAARKIAA